MTTNSRRRLRAAALMLAGAVVMTGCVSTGAQSSPPRAASATDAPGPLTLQSWLVDKQKTGIETLASDFNAQGKGQVDVNSIPTETFRAQLPTYLTSANPPDLYTWLAGASTRAYAKNNLLLDLTDVWKKVGDDFPKALRALSQDSNKKEVFLPTSYYWWGIYYRKSVFVAQGITPPKTWDDFLAACVKLKKAGINPIGIGLSDTSWRAEGWFDYLDLRINGAAYHLDLLAGKHSFTDAKVKKVFTTWNQILPYFDPSALGVPYAQSVTDFMQGKTAMMLSGAGVQNAIPAAAQSDLAFFQFPIIDASVPVAEEAPTDGFFASASTTKPNLVKEFLTYASSAAVQDKLAANSGGTALPANSKTKLTLTAFQQQGKSMLESAAQLTQFFNRDASDALSVPAATALTQYIAQPQNIDKILADWQAAAEKVRSNQ